jgi:hypothetical protein
MNHGSQNIELQLEMGRMTVFWIIFVNTSITLVLTIIAAVRRPELKYKVIASIALCAFIAALHQAIKNQFTPLAVIFPLVLSFALLQIIRKYLLTLSKSGKR